MSYPRRKLQIAKFADAAERMTKKKKRETADCEQGLLVMDAFLTQSWCLDLRNNEYQCPSRGICKDEGGLCGFN